jgi:hypothetical protein
LAATVVGGPSWAVLGGRTRERAREAAWAGRSRQLPDAADVAPALLHAALRVDPPAPGRGALADLGMVGVVVPSRGETLAVYQGARHGRPVHYRSDDDHGVSTAVWLGVVAPPVRLAADRGVLAQQGAAVLPPELLAALRPSPWWDGTRIGGGPGGLTARRDGRVAQGWLYDLWLLERLADALALAPVPAPDATRFVPPEVA